MAGDEIDTELEPAFEVDAVQSGAVYVVVRWNDQVVVRELAMDAELTVGRSQDAGIVVEDTRMSRLHLRLTRGERGVVVVDLGSRNGTRVNASVLHSAERVIHPGDVVRAGPAEIVMAAHGARVERMELADASLESSGVLVADPEMMKALRLAQRVALAPTTVLIVGETGVGKEVVAEQIHRWSDRKHGPFLRLNCASVPETLFESELFGHERGAFTGADRTRVGYLEAADRGTLLLDEIGELPLAVQTKLLRVLETRRVGRLGATTDREVDVRFVCATHRDLAADVSAGRFREDLYYRIGVFPVRVPPLRERPADIALLSEWFARTFATRLQRPVPRIQPAASARLAAYAWPGNVRELRNAMEVAVVMAESGSIELEHLPETLRKRVDSVAPGAIRHAVADTERRTIEEALAAANGNRTHAAMRLGISRRALVYKLAKYGIR